MSVWLIAVPVTIYSLVRLWAFWAWLRFCRHIADKHGAKHLETLPPLAVSFGAHQWLPSSFRRRPGNPES